MSSNPGFFFFLSPFFPLMSLFLRLLGVMASSTLSVTEQKPSVPFQNVTGPPMPFENVRDNLSPVTRVGMCCGAQS